MKNILKSICRFISKLVPKKKNLWLFGCWDGHLYADNSKYMYEYIQENCPEVKCVWISKERSIVSMLKKQGKRVKSARSISGIWSLMRAEVFFETSGFNDLSYFIVEKVTEIQLWHGMGFKNVGKNDPQSHRDADLEKFQKNTTYHLAHWMVASEEAKQKYADSFDVPIEKFYITGQPKDDKFIDLQDDSLFKELLKNHQNANTKVAFYLPTHRNFGRKDDKSMLSLDLLIKVNESLKKMNVVMLYKPHYNDIKHFESFNVSLSNILFLLDFEKYGDIYTILPFCDMMISDYSGIIFGYLNANKPIILFPYDYDTYVNGDMGFCYDYKEVAAGPICMTWEEVLKKIEEILQVGDKYQEKRQVLKARFCLYSDGKNRERVVKKVKNILGKKRQR